MTKFRPFAIILLLSILMLCGWTIQNRTRYPVSQIQELPNQILKASDTILDIQSDDDFQRIWPRLNEEMTQIDSAMQALLRFASSEGGSKGFSDEDYEHLAVAREKFLNACSRLKQTISSENSMLVRSSLRTELDPRTAAQQSIGVPVANLVTTYKLPLSLFAGILIWLVAQPAGKDMGKENGT